MLEPPKTFLPKGGGYGNLAVYKKATVIYDLTFHFTKRFLAKGITLLHQFDNMMGKLLERLQKDFVEKGGRR